MKFCNKYSGSHGNLTIIDDGSTRVLIDCGGTSNALKKALSAENLTFNDIDGVLITHEHSDHVSALESFLLLNDKAKVFVHRDGCDALLKKVPAANKRINIFDNPFCLKSFFVDFYVCSHDTAMCCGYKLTTEDGLSVASVTDTGKIDQDKIEDFFKNCHTVMIESNHDQQMVLSGNYPYPLKRRILGEKGHLSNVQAGAIIKRLPELNVRNAFLSHLSMDNNTEEIAFKEAIDAIETVGAKEGRDLNLFVARQFCGGDSIIVKK